MTVTLTPELAERVVRMARDEKRDAEQVISDALLAAWVRFATRHGIKGDQWRA